MTPNDNVRRFSSKEELDDFPTPPWATRAFFEYVALERDGDYDESFLKGAK